MPESPLRQQVGISTAAADLQQIYRNVICVCHLETVLLDPSPSFYLD